MSGGGATDIEEEELAVAETGAAPLLDKKVAVITGGTRGIGRAVVERLAADGYAVVLGYAGRADLADEVVAQLRNAGTQAVAVQGDIADERVAAALFDRAEAEFGGVDVAVNVAGRMPVTPVVDLDLNDLDELYRIDRKSVV